MSKFVYAALLLVSPAAVLAQSPAATKVLPAGTTLLTSEAIIPEGAEWSYYTPIGVPRGDWKNGEDAAGWKNGPTKIGWGDRGLATVFSADEDASAKYPVAYIRKVVRLPDHLKGRPLSFSMNCDDGCIAFLNGKEIGRLRLPEGEVKPYGADIAFPPTPKIIEISPSLLQDGDNHLAVEVHQSARESSDMKFTATLEAR